MKLRHSVSLALAALALTGSGALFAQSTSGSSDTAQEFALPILAGGDSFTDSFEGEVGTKLYGFQGSAGDEVTVTMTQITDDLDPYLVILGPNGEVIASDDDSGTDEIFSAAITDAELPADGSYFIIASSYANINTFMGTEIESEQEYTLTLEGNTVPTAEGFDPELLTITVAELTDDETVNAETTAESPVSYFIFTAEEGASLDIVVEEADFDTILYLFDAEGARIAVNDDDADRGVLESAINGFEAPYTGSYLVMVTNLTYYDSVGGDESSFIGGEFSLTANVG